MNNEIKNISVYIAKLFISVFKQNYGCSYKMHVLEEKHIYGIM